MKSGGGMCPVYSATKSPRKQKVSIAQRIELITASIGYSLVKLERLVKIDLNIMPASRVL